MDSRVPRPGPGQIRRQPNHAQSVVHTSDNLFYLLFESEISALSHTPPWPTGGPPGVFLPGDLKSLLMRSTRLVDRN